jgi:hypothetical protein
MHLEILVEGQSDRTALEPILAKILGPYNNPHTWSIIKHRGQGKLPGNPQAKPDPFNPTLLHNLPAKLRAYGKSLKPDEGVVIVIDLDDKDCLTFKNELNNLLNYCDKRPKTLFRLAIEELEAWFLGDRNAFISAYPKAKHPVLDSYKQDSICGTWELIADAIYPGGSVKLKEKGSRYVLNDKLRWAKDIAPKMDIQNNLSPSFKAFRDGLKKFVSVNED